MKLKLPKIKLKKEKRIVINPGEVEIKEPEEAKEESQGESNKREKKPKKEKKKKEKKKKEKKPKEKKPKKEKKSKKKKEAADTPQEGEAEQSGELVKKSNKKLIIIAAICVLVIVICVVLWFVLLRPKNEETPTDEEIVVEEEPVVDEKQETTKVLPHSNVVYNTDRWYDDSNWSYDSSYYTDFEEICDEDSCLLSVTESLNGATFTFKLQKSALFESCTDYLCTTTTTDGQLSYVEITYPDGTVGERYNAGEYRLKSLNVWTLVSNALYSDMKNGVTDFSTMCDTAKKEAMDIVEHQSELENNAYNEVIVYLRSCRYAGKYK